MTRVTLGASLAALLVSLGSFDSSRSVQDPEPTDEEQESDSSLVVATTRFALHSHPWIGLHHFLYQWARSETERSPRDTRPAPRVQEKAALAEWEDAERDEWNAAWQYYREHAVPRSLTFDARMRDLKTEVAAIDADAARPSDEQMKELGELGIVLAAAMPLYREHFWADHDKMNRAWIREQARSLELYEKRLTDGLLRAYGGEWPKGAIRIDIAPHTNWAGAYTTNHPNHIMMSSTDPDLDGWLGLETIFHEASHTTPLEGGHIRAVDEAFEALGKKAPERLWHAFLFYTAGELTRDVLSEAGVKDYVPYAEKLGFYDRASWAGYRDAFEEYWRPVLEGELARAEAYAGIAHDLSSR